MVEWAAVEAVLHRVQNAGRVAFHDEGYVGVQRAEGADLEVGGYVGVVDEGGVCAADVLGGVLLVHWTVMSECLLRQKLTLFPLMPFQVALEYCNQECTDAI